MEQFVTYSTLNPSVMMTVITETKAFLTAHLNQ